MSKYVVLDRDELIKEVGGLVHSLAKDDYLATEVAEDLSLSLDSLSVPLPAEKEFTPAKDLPDHWGLTVDSIKRQVENQSNIGWNYFRSEIIRQLSERKGRGC